MFYFHLSNKLTNDLPVLTLVFVTMICATTSVHFSINAAHPEHTIKFQQKHIPIQIPAAPVLSDNGLIRIASDDPPFPIDIVYTWVNGSDLSWQNEFNKAASEFGIKISNNQAKLRFVDVDELRHSIRSIEKNINWYNKIYIITANQRPNWIRVDHPRIVFVNHDEIFPKNFKTPSFSSGGIESNLHLIPGLSEHFVYFNDDVFIGQPLPYTYFFTPEGKPVLYYINWNWDNAERRFKQLESGSLKNDMGGNQFECVTLFTTMLIKNHFGKNPFAYCPHMPFPTCKSLIAEVEKTFQEDFNRTRFNRFRDYRNVFIQQLVLQYGIFTHKVEIITVTPEITVFYMVESDLTFARLPNNEASLPQTFCINTDSNNFRGAVKNWLSKTFPSKSSFERETA